MEIRFNIQGSKAYWRDAVRMINRHAWTHDYCLGVKVIAVVAVVMTIGAEVFLSIKTEHVVDPGGLMVLVLAMAVLFWSPEISDWFELRKLKTMPSFGDTCAFTISDDGMRVQGEKRDSIFRWPAFSHVVQTSDGLLLFEGKVQKHWLPQKAFATPEDFQTALSIIQTHVAKLKRIRKDCP
ncbi:MAG: YcxB family protein [Verrucomicrobiota bacterium]|jgi:hypothetical protein|nr:YcxB family protein [Verrucomicrobiota bacterium]